MDRKKLTLPLWLPLRLAAGVLVFVALAIMSVGERIDGSRGRRESW